MFSITKQKKEGDLEGQESEPPEPPSKKLFNASKEEWNDWKWQLRNRLTTFQDLKRLEIQGLKETNYNLPLSITPYYSTLLYGRDINYPLCKAVIPSSEELIKSDGEENDPLHEDDMSPAPNIVHRYPDRVLFLITGTCASYCRYCTRSRKVGNENCYSLINLQEGLDYVKSHPEVRDILLSGGDPLTLTNSTLETMLQKLYSIKHIEIIRIGTKVPVVLPQRICKGVLDVLKKYHPLYINIHFTHPDEITTEVSEACNKLADAGIPLGSQTVLLKEINDDANILKELFLKLVKIRVKPYYLYSMDRIIGSRHFAVPVEKGIDLINKLTGNITGFAIPKFVIDAPKGGGKIPINSDNIINKENGVYKLRNYKNLEYEYPIVDWWE